MEKVRGRRDEGKEVVWMEGLGRGVMDMNSVP